MKRTIQIQLIVEPGENFNATLELAVCEYFKSKGWNASVPHSYPESVLVLECPDVIPTLKQ